MYSSHRRESDVGRSRQRAARLVALLIAVAAMGVAVAAASAASRVPRAPADLGATAANHGLQVEPAGIIYTGDGTGFLSGGSARRNARIHWTEWTGRVALGTGFNRVNNCEPSCATAPFHAYRVRIELWRARSVHGAVVFTRMTIFYVGARPPGDPRHYTFTDLYVGPPGGFGWGPPSAGYCTQPGLGRVAGCKNIHSLP